jgi:formate dehydrogenase major subunit
LVPLDSTAVGSNTPTSKSVIIRLERMGAPGSIEMSGQQPVGADDHHKEDPEPLHLS